MADRSSRHRGASTYRRKLHGRELELYEPREVPLSRIESRHRVDGDDRLDHLAHEYFSDPFQYWRIADANPAGSPEELLEPGRLLDIPESD